MTAEFGVLGVVAAQVSGRSVDLGHARQRSVLGVLLVEAGRPVPVDQLIDRVWGESVPQRVTNALYSYISRLRRALADAPTVAIQRQPGGYRVTADPQTVDLHRFRRLVAQARNEALDQRATEQYAQALGLWRGEPLAGLESPWLTSMRHVLLRERFAAELDRNDVLLRLGRHAELLPDLAAAVTDHPLDERLAEQSMLALYRCGRQADADEQYRRIRRCLADELGSDPGLALRSLHERILAADPGLMAPPAGANASGARLAAVAAAAPAQLPADVRAFTGRAEELAVLDRLLPTAGGSDTTTSTGTAPTIALLSGTAGVGKSALAVRWAHHARPAFPDGQLYVDLRGYDAEQPVAAADALAWFLNSLGIRGPEIPLEVEERAARYRSALAGRQMLILLDNASSVEQIRPLLPGSGSCLVLITSRDSLPGMVAVHGAERVNLDLLPLAEAVGLLRRLIGARVDREPSAAAELAAACARLPLALRIGAELAATRTDATLAELVVELGDHSRLDLLDAGGDPRAEVRAVFSWSYQNLPADAARVFRLFGLQPGVDAHVDAVAALTGVRAAEARRLLGLLARASLINACGPGRYGMHDLLRAYAGELAAEHDPAPDRRTALTTLFDHYLARSVAAMAALYPTPTAEVGDPDAARRWIAAEWPNLAAICLHGAAHGWRRHAIALAETLFRYLDEGGPVAEAVTVTSAAVTAARAEGDLRAQAQALSNLGRLHRRHGQLDRAAETYRQALARYVGLGDRAAEAGALRNLGSVRWRQGHYRQAAEHYQQALALYQGAGDEAGQADALVRLALVDERLGDQEQAVERLQPALELFAQLDDEYSEAYVFSLIARLRRREDQLELSAARLELSLAAVREMGGRTGEAYVLTDLAAVYACLGRPTDAAGHLRQALLLHRRIGDRASEAEVLNDLGRVLGAAGNPAGARAQHAEALALASEIGDRYELARAHDGIAATYENTDEPDLARPHHEHARELFSALSVPNVPGHAGPGDTGAVNRQPTDQSQHAP
ncbi:AfsR/SARP family transcriptional regulator [Pilimelia columellifera]|uniref:Tetratricopeptide repeat protein n=1 Tax=Pilimelia columellifera subsp. columellifera TaxID=706583 RepID=A0ABN3MZM1_9ACTN